MRHLEHFGLSRNPFSKEVQPEAFYASASFQEGLKRLDFFVANSEGIAALVGQPGCGKTTLVEYFSNQMKDHDRAQVSLWNFTSTASYGLLAVLIRHLGGRPPRCKSEVALRLADLLASPRLPTVLAIDEAQLLPDDSLQDLRLLIEMPTKGKLLLLLVAQSLLADRLADEAHLSLRQRLAITHFLSPLSRQETSDYLDQRLRAARGSIKLLDPKAVDLIFEHSQGIPRLINRLALQSLMAAASRGKNYVEESCVQAAYNDIERL